MSNPDTHYYTAKDTLTATAAVFMANGLRWDQWMSACHWAWEQAADGCPPESDKS